MRGNLRGILWLMGSIPCFQAMNVMLRHTATELPAPEVMFFRNFFGFLVLAPWLLRKPASLKTRRWGAHILRAGAHVCGMILWVYALTLIPLATATALAFSSPLFVVIAATLFMGERAGVHRWSAVIVGFVGVLIVYEPFDHLNALDRPGALGPLMVLASALLLACSKLLTKVVAREDSTLAVVFYLNVFMAIGALAPAVVVWVPPQPTHYLWFLLLAAVGALAQICLTKAVVHAELSALQPFEFLALIWAAVLGFILFAEVPEIPVFVGGALIVLAASYIVHRETMHQKAPSELP